MWVQVDFGCLHLQKLFVWFCSEMWPSPGCGLQQAAASMLLRPPLSLSPPLQCWRVTRPHHPQGPCKFRSSIFTSCESSSKWEAHPLRDNTNIAHQREGHRIFTYLRNVMAKKTLFQCFLNSQITLLSCKHSVVPQPWMECPVPARGFCWAQNNS